jgi:hypothetical protein
MSKFLKDTRKTMISKKKSKAGRVLVTCHWNPALVTQGEASEAGRFLGQLPRKQKDKKPTRFLGQLPRKQENKKPKRVGLGW